MNKVLNAIRPQLILIGALLILNVLSGQGVIPSTTSMASAISRLFQKHGLPLIATCSFIENIVGVNAYFPGSIAVLAGMALTAGDPYQAILTYFAIVVPAAIANLLSYILGRRLKKQEGNLLHSQSTGKRSEWLLYFSTYWHPHLAATTSFVAGTRDVPLYTFFKFFSSASLFWSLFWAVTVYNFGAIIKVDSNLSFLIYLYLAIWTAWDLWQAIKEKAEITL